jgi:tellurite methyltransferase
MTSPDLHEQFGPIDVYLFDQILKGRIPSGNRVLDAGSGHGRNLVWFLRQGYDVHAADSDAGAIGALRAMAAELAPQLPEENFRIEPVEALSFADGFANAVISSAVLHFARDDAHFEAMLNESWRVLSPGGLFFCRLASSIGMENQVRPISGRRHLLPDGSERYLVDEKLLMERTRSLGGRLLDPLKTTIVHGQRCMTTWVLRKM